MRTHSRPLSLRALLLAALAVSTIASAYAETPNPFTSSGGPTVASTPASKGIVALAPLLRLMTDRLTELANQIRDAKTPGPMLALALVSLLYGIFHALGPGHGKTIVSTFFLAKDAKLKQSLIAGFFIALVHAISALTMVLILFFLIRGIFSVGFENASRIVQTVSFGIIAVIGAVMLVQRIRGKEHSHGHFLEKKHEHEHEDDEIQEGEPGIVTNRELLGIAIASGIVPCPGASAIILVCLSLNVLLAGVVAVTMISIGMGLTVSLIGAAAILVKRGVLKASSAGQKGGTSLARRIVEITGSAVLFLFGLVFFIAQV